jgi:hypothetical protein
MNDLEQLLGCRAERDGLSLDGVKHLHLLQGVLRRWVRSGHVGQLVLGGGLLTQQWVGSTRRTTKDLDFVGLFPHDLGAAIERFAEILALDADDGIEFDLDTIRGEVTWPETRFPGTRSRFLARLLGEERELHIDVGFGFPLVPPVWPMDYPCLVGPGVRVPALRPELLVAWKLDGLFEHGRSRWLPKGLHDLYLLTRYRELDQTMLEDGIRASFESKSIPVERVLDMVYSRAWWEKETCQNKWSRFQATAPYPVPESLLHVASGVARALRPVLERIIVFPPDQVWLGDEEKATS